MWRRRVLWYQHQWNIQWKLTNPGTIQQYWHWQNQARTSCLPSNLVAKKNIWQSCGDWEKWCCARRAYARTFRRVRTCDGLFHFFQHMFDQHLSKYNSLWHKWFANCRQHATPKRHVLYVRILVWAPGHGHAGDDWRWWRQRWWARAQKTTQASRQWHIPAIVIKRTEWQP